MNLDHTDMSNKKFGAHTAIYEVEMDLEKAKEILNFDEPECPHCHSKNVYGMSRIVGYFSIIENWNKSKQSERKRRRVGNYWCEEI